MKKMNKVWAVLLSVAMLCTLIPSFAVSAAAVGTVANGGFEEGIAAWTISGAEASTDYKKYDSYSLKMPINSATYGKVVASQVIPVNKNAVYTLSFWCRYAISLNGSGTYQYEVVAGTNDTTFGTTLVQKTNVNNGTTFKETTKSGISVGSNTYICIRFYAPSSGNRTHYLDGVSLTATTVGDESTHSDPTPTMTGFGAEMNRPKSDSVNKVTQGGFESTSGAQWNTNTFIKNNLSVVSEGAYSGNSCLYYQNASTMESWHTFTINVEANTEYVLSAWVKAPYLSGNNTGLTSLGIIDPDTNQFIYSSLAAYKFKQSGPKKALRPTAMDNRWHLRAMTFRTSNTETVTVAVYGKKSQMWIDDLSVHKLTDGMEYVGARRSENISGSTSVTNKYCKAEDNLIPDCNMNSGVSKNFWSTNSGGWNNGFMSIVDAGDDHGRVMKYTAGAKVNYNFFKWIPVEPNTDYTMSFDYKVLTTGNGMIKLVDNDIELPEEFGRIPFTSRMDKWEEYAVTFNSGVHNQIGFVVLDAGGTAMIDDIRLFKTYDENGNANGTSTEPVEEVFAALKPANTGTSTSDPENQAPDVGNALAFRVELPATGLTISEDHRFIGYDSTAMVDALGTGVKYKLVAMGAIMCNNPNGASTDHMVIGNATPKGSTINIVAEKGISVANGIAEYAVRIVNIPDPNIQTTIYARPYYVFEYEGEEVVVYGDIVSRCYKEAPNVNDGQLDWS